MLAVERIYETVLYADDLEAAAKFYRDGLGLKLLSQNELMLVFAAGENYLLIFNAEKSSAAGRMVPAHGAKGAGHIAFAASAKERQAWKARLIDAQIEIESIVQWDKDRGYSIYVRDPAGNSVEFAPPGLWSYLEAT